MTQEIINDIFKYIENSLSGLPFKEYNEIALAVGDRLCNAMISDFKAYDNIRSQRYKRLEAELEKTKDELENLKAEKDWLEDFYLRQIAIHNINKDNAEKVKAQRRVITDMQRSYKDTIAKLNARIKELENEGQ